MQLTTLLKIAHLTKPVLYTKSQGVTHSLLHTTRAGDNIQISHTLPGHTKVAHKPHYLSRGSLKLFRDTNNPIKVHHKLSKAHPKGPYNLSQPL